MVLQNHCIGRSKSWTRQLHDQTLCFCAETKGWAWCKHNAELVEPTVALRNLLLAGSGCLEIQKGVAGIDSLDKHVQQVSFRQCVEFCEHGQLKGRQPHFQPTVAKISILAMVLQNHCIGRSKSWTKQLHDQTLCLGAWDRHFSVAETKGWAWWKHNIADPVEQTVALRNLLLVESGCLEIPNGMAGIDSLDDKHIIQQISFRQCVTFCQHGSWKAGSPASNPLLLKTQSRQLFIGLQQSDSTTESTMTDLGDHNLTKRFASLHQTRIFLQWRDGHDASIMQNWWSVLSLSGTCFW